VNPADVLRLTPEGTLVARGDLGRELTPDEKKAIRDAIPPGSPARTEVILSLMNRAVLAAMTDAAFDTLTDEAVAARVASGLTWQDEPWAMWGRLLNDEGERRQPRYRPTHEQVAAVERIHGGHRATILRLLLAAGPRGVTNHELQDAIGKGARHSARIGELTSTESKKHGGWLIDSIKVDGNTHRWRLVGRLPGYGETQRRLDDAA
jgi:hypothetical protein